MDHSLLTKNITAGYRDTDILHDINVVIPDHKISVIIGANACGKSTLLKTMARLLNIRSGSVLLDGESISKIPSKKLAQTLGLLPQTLLTPEGIRVFDLVSRGRFPYQKLFDRMRKEDIEAVEEAIDLMGIQDIKQAHVDELSGGQRQRVWIAMALAQQTDILLLDEPTTYLDIAHQIEILDLLADLNRKKGTTIVMVLHDINLSARYANYMFAMRQGRVITHGTPHEIINEQLILDVFNLPSVVVEDPLSKSPLIIPKSKHHMK